MAAVARPAAAFVGAPRLKTAYGDGRWPDDGLSIIVSMI